MSPETLKPKLFQNTLDIQRLTSSCEVLHNDVEKLAKSVEQLMTNQSSKEIMFLKIENGLEEMKVFKEDMSELFATVRSLREDRDRRDASRKRLFTFILPILVPCVTILLASADYIYLLKHKG